MTSFMGLSAFETNWNEEDLIYGYLGNNGTICLERPTGSEWASEWGILSIEDVMPTHTPIDRVTFNGPVQ